jgi:outer membrane lipoprotein-sorting protein
MLICALAVAILSPVASGPARAAEGRAPPLDVAQVLERNAAARGGLDAWRKVKTMVWGGHVERGDGSGGLPFMFYQKRPNLTRFEIQTDQQKAVRVFDGQQGWKLRPEAGARAAPEPYGEEELRAARDAPVIDGPVLDGKARGLDIGLEGMEDLDGRPTYRLRVVLPSGTTERVWIDAETFLETRYERPVRDPAGHVGTAVVSFRSYKAYDGLQMPFVIETGTAGGRTAASRLVIDRIAVDVPLSDGIFARPGLRTARRGFTVDTRGVSP